MSRADRFDESTMALIVVALEAKAKAHDEAAAKLPREYSTGVLTSELHMRGVHVESARANREAIKTTRAMADRYKKLRKTEAA